MGCRTLLLTLNLDRIAWQPCNPAVGGPAKSQLVHEVDAMGGEIGRMADRCYLQKRVLNRSKVGSGVAPRGKEVPAPRRAQTCRRLGPQHAHSHPSCARPAPMRNVWMCVCVCVCVVCCRLPGPGRVGAARADGQAGVCSRDAARARGDATPVHPRGHGHRCALSYVQHAHVVAHACMLPCPCTCTRACARHRTPGARLGHATPPCVTPPSPPLVRTRPPAPPAPPRHRQASTSAPTTRSAAWPRSSA
jgi:hypothetical protein